MQSKKHTGEVISGNIIIWFQALLNNTCNTINTTTAGVPVTDVEGTTSTYNTRTWDL